MSHFNVHYAKTSSGGNVAVGVMGSGPTVVATPNALMGSDFQQNRFLEPLFEQRDRLTLVEYDHIGSGLSDRDGYEFTSEVLLDELEVVIDSVDEENVSLLGWGPSSHTAIRYAASRPSRLSSLTLLGWPRGFDCVQNPPYRAYLQAIRTDWDTACEYATVFWSQLHGDEARARAAVTRSITSFEANLKYLDWFAASDVTDLLPQVRVPTLVLQPRVHSFYPHEFGKALAAGIPGARLAMVDYPGNHAFDPVPEFVLQHAGVPNQHSAESPAPTSELSPRETEVIALVAAGRSNHDIAQTLFLSQSTVERHVHNILGKLGVSNRVEAATWWTKHGGSAD